ncbi:MAG TPA: dihydroneopterin aldolase [Candidatus Limnocylindrales bacterium]|nr:dihydroneopterin aldolase [Candidatus Limnocylindrales bacterium]
MTDRIFLHGMAFVGRHGVTEDERVEPQQIEVDLEARLDLRAAGAGDDLGRTVDYGALFEIARLVVEEHSFRLLEAIAESIAAAALEAHPRIEAVSVTVRKPGVPIEGVLEQAGVSVERRR